MNLSEIEQQLISLEQRLLRLENSVIKPVQQPVPAKVWPSEIAAAKAAIKTEAVSPKSIGVEKSGNWLGVIAVICFVLAAAFIIKLSIETGWLTPIRQIGTAIVFGLCLIGSGFLLMNSDREYASLLPATGAVVLYLTGFAAYRLYSLISFEVAIAAICLISGLCIWLYLKIKHNTYAITAAVGSYVAPIILGVSADSSFSIYYFLLCSVAFATISIWAQSRMLTLVTAYLAILMTGYVGNGLNLDGLVATALALHFFIFAMGLYFYTDLTRTPLNENESWMLMPVLLIFYVMEYHYINRLHPGLAPWISLGFAAFMMGLYLSAKKWFPNRSLSSAPIIISFVTLVCFHSAYLELLPSAFRPWLFVVIILAFALSPKKVFGTKGTVARIPVFALGAIVLIEYLSMVSLLLEKTDTSVITVSFASFISLWILQISNREKISKATEYGFVLLGSSHILAVLGFYRLTQDFGSLAVSASWLCYAIFVMALAFVRKDKIMAKSALFVLAFAAGKALLYDASSAETIVRILCLVLTGVALYGAGFLMRKISAWQ